MCNFWFEKERKQKRKKKAKDIDSWGVVGQLAMQSRAVEGLSDKKVFLQFEWWSDLVHLISSAGISLKWSWLTVWDADTETLRSPCWEPRPIKGPSMNQDYFRILLFCVLWSPSARNYAFFFLLHFCHVGSFTFISPSPLQTWKVVAGGFGALFFNPFWCTFLADWECLQCTVYHSLTPPEVPAEVNKEAHLGLSYLHWNTPCSLTKCCRLTAD